MSPKRWILLVQEQVGLAYSFRRHALARPRLLAVLISYPAVRYRVDNLVRPRQLMLSLRPDRLSTAGVYVHGLLWHSSHVLESEPVGVPTIALRHMQRIRRCIEERRVCR